MPPYFFLFLSYRALIDAVFLSAFDRLPTTRALLVIPGKLRPAAIATPAFFSFIFICVITKDNRTVDVIIVYKTIERPAGVFGA